MNDYQYSVGYISPVDGMIEKAMEQYHEFLVKSVRAAGRIPTATKVSTIESEGKVTHVKVDLIFDDEFYERGV